MLKIEPKNISVPKLHAYLLGSIGPRPIALASTIDENGNPNLAPFSFFNVFSANPPIAIFSPARRGRDNTTKHTYENLQKVREVVINVVTYDMVEQTSLASTDFPKGISEFEKAGFTPIASEMIKPFRVKESPVHLECKVNDIVQLGSEGGAGNLIIAEVLLMHIHDRILNEDGYIDQHKIDLVGRMGGNWYCRASGSAIFEVEKPLAKIGIGIDKLPKDIRNSTYLSGNDLGKLGNVKSLPDETVVNDYKLTELSDIFLKFEEDGKALEKSLHERAKSLLNKNQVEDAWLTLLSYNP